MVAPAMRVLALIFVIAIAGLLVSCGGDDGANENADEAVSVEGEREDVPWDTPAESLPRIAVRVDHLDAGDSHVCAVKSNGNLACWGSNGDGESSPPSGTFRQVSPNPPKR